MADMARRRRKIRNPLFRKRWFADDTIIQCVNWYLRFKLSYRDLAQIMGQLGVSIAFCTILRWAIRYSVDFAESMRPFEKCNPPRLIPSPQASFLRLSLRGLEGSVRNRRA
jgi:hypothetical protein